ncbi:MAG TPA: tRNA 5-methoxyuridine(34)/uridine 5-oxyacetic acid(34) synthase CmoB [Chromatiaceae bacterium]|nr:tRNA 5-methoxyuridine(34)/uridine 5-oxyacetic acid(34) synthase CmoB [Chromatiaceae bacterium]
MHDQHDALYPQTGDATAPFRPFLDRLGAVGFARWIHALAELTGQRLAPGAHGDLRRWRAAMEAMPSPPSELATLDAAAVGVAGVIDPRAQSRLREALMTLHPWRKGPYRLHGVSIDSEWRSDWKWDRLAPHLSPLSGRRVLDVGCGNGYHAWRALGAGADLVLGIDPTLLSVMQFLAVARLLGESRVAVLPLALADLPPAMTGFDTLFSMGVLYHRRAPLDHLRELHRLLRPGGELVLETLVVEGQAGQVLVPAGRYARMRNVCSIPTPATLEAWVADCGFRRARVVDVTATTRLEQRSTEWMRFESLAEALDPVDPGRTLEGLPAPRRALVIASA